MFKRRRFPVEIILVCVRWYCKYWISYRDVVEMVEERGVEVDPSTIMRWVHFYAPELENRVRAYQGFETMRMIRRGHCLTCKHGVHNEIRFVNLLFQIAA
jgi:transposase-like protein